MRPIAIDLFSGAGGMSLGFEQAGFDVVCAVEIDPIHAATHEFNFPNTRVLCRSVVGLSGDETRSFAGVGRQRIDVIFGGAPCQGFSMMGHRALDDPRNGLVREFVRLVQELRPSYFVFENVKGLTVGQHRTFLLEIVEAFDDIGYRTKTPWRILNAADYGVPQDRERLFLIGARRGLPLPEYPTPSVIRADFNGPCTLLPMGPTCGDALEDLPDADSLEQLLQSDEANVALWRPNSRYASLLHCTSDDCWGFGYPREWNRNLLTASLRTTHSEISRRRFQDTEQGQVEPISRFYRLPMLGISNTLRAGTDSARGAFTSPRPIHYRYARCVTVREMARLHGFPDWFRFHVTKWHGARQIGNAVPPPLARAVATSVLEKAGLAPQKEEKALGLGDVALLRQDMSAAAAHFGVPVPIGRRNMRSGARKRKQIEIELGRLALEANG